MSIAVMERLAMGFAKRMVTAVRLMVTAVRVMPTGESFNNMRYTRVSFIIYSYE